MRKILRKPIMSAETGGKGCRKSCDVRKQAENIGETRKRLLRDIPVGPLPATRRVFPPKISQNDSEMTEICAKWHQEKPQYLYRLDRLL